MTRIRTRANRTKYGWFRISRRGGLFGRKWQRITVNLPFFRTFVLWERAQ